MSYWHMNLHPTDHPITNDEIKKIILGQVIGMGIWDEGKGKEQRDNFKDSMKIGDIVAVMNGQTPIALVEVIGNCYEFNHDENSIIWFPLRRAVKILELKKEFVSNAFPSRTQTLKIASDKETDTYKFIEGWHKGIVC